ncbi:MAG: LamG domain-containing protein, partial [Ignavibacteriae bacterium]
VPVGKYLHPNGDGSLIFWENGYFGSLYTVNTFANYCRVDLDDGLTPNVWHHVVVTMDHIDGMIMYVDNVRADFAGWRGQVAKSRTSEPLRFGIINSVHLTEKPVPFKGAISDFAVYNRVLTEAERTQLYTSTK